MELLLKLKERGIQVFLEDDKLKFKAPKGALTEELKNDLSAQKQALMDYLKQARISERHESIPQAEAADEYPLSPAQFRMHVLSRFDGGNSAYIIPGIKILKGKVDHVLLEKSVQHLIERHESLRTFFTEDPENGKLAQRILPFEKTKFRLELTDLRQRTNPGKEQEEILERLLTAPFDLSQAPLLRAGLIRTGEETWLFAFCMHHIISDGWSMEVLTREIIAIYAAVLSGHSGSVLPPLQIQYKDYACWLNKQFESDSRDRMKNYWLEKLGGELPLLHLPADFQRPALHAFDGDRIYAVISPAVVENLKRLAVAEGGTLYMSILTAVNILFHRLTGDGDIIIGSPVAGRDHPDLQNQIGYYANTLAFRNTFSGSDPVREVFRKVRTTTLEAYEHQHYPFDQLVQDLQLRRDLSRSPVFDVVVTLQNISLGGASQLPDIGFTASDYTNDRQVSHFDLTFTFSESASGLELVVDFSTALYKKERVSAFVELLRVVMENMPAGLDTAIDRIPYLPAAVSEQVITQFNERSTAYSSGSSVLDLIEQQFRHSPGATAVEDFNGTLTYEQLCDVARMFGAWLTQEKQIQPGDKVVVRLPVGAYYLPVMLGIWYSGAVYVPVDVEYPSERVGFILQDVKSKCLVDENLLDAFLASGIAEAAPAGQRKYGWDDTAYMIYTSGSTGKPKGVRVDHRSLAHMLDVSVQLFGTEACRMPLMASPAFDISLFEMLYPLVTGGTSFLFEKKKMLEADQLVELLPRFNFLDAVPTLMNQIFLMVAPGDCPRVFGGLKRVGIGGERVPDILLQRIRESAPQATITVLYGPTENTIYCTEYSYLPGGETEEMRGEILGWPVPGRKIFILDKYLQPVAPGVSGELYAGGLGVAQGYHDREELTQKLFLADPFSPGERMYRSGDLARWTSDGRIEFLGRGDGQVKIRGYRIETGEVEDALGNQAGVTSVAVRLCHDNSGEPFLAGYYSAAAELDPVTLRAGMGKTLPAYMLPRQLIYLEKLPLTPNGKIDYKKLPAPEPAEETVAAAVEQPEGVEEQTLAAIWKDVLGISSIGRKSNFYELGGDSIKSIQVSTRMRQAGFALKVADVLQHAVLADLALRVQPLRRTIDQSAVTGEVPLSPIQSEFLYGGHAEPHHFNQSVMLQSRRRIRVEDLRAGIAKLVSHHDALRMKFSFDGTSWSAFNTEEGAAPEIWEKEIPAGADWLERVADTGNELQASFDLSKPPLIRAALIHGPEEDRVIIAVHHLVVDGVSWRILLEDLGAILQRGSDTLPLKTDSFRTWCLALQQYASGESLRREVAWWEQTGLAPVSEINADIADADGFFGDTDNYSFSFSKELTAQIRNSAARAYHAEINDLLLAATGLAFHDLFGTGKLAVSLEGHGREEIFPSLDINRTVGWFTTKYPVVIDTVPGVHPGINLVAVKETLHRVPNKGIGYGILRYLSPEEIRKEISFRIKPRVSFNYLGEFAVSVGDEQSDLRLSADDRGASASARMKREHLLDIVGIITEQQLQFSIGYSTKQFRRETMERLAAHIRKRLEELTAHCAGIQVPVKTPVDFPGCRLSPEQCFELQQEGVIEDIYPLSKLQQGIYFHYLKDRSIYAYYEQMAFRLTAGFDLELIRKSYAAITARHAVLRTAFREAGGDVVQVVFRDVDTRVTYEDLRGLDVPEQQKKIKTYQQEDREKYFDLAQVHAMRLHVFQLSADKFAFVWSHHHILMDGWCMGILISEFFRLMESFRTGVPDELPPAQPYGSYIKWLTSRQQEESLAFWKRSLEGYHQTASMPKRKRIVPGAAYAYRTHHFHLNETASAGLDRLARRLGVTGSTVFQAAWARLLSVYNQTDDVVFGIVVSGRPAELTGVEKMVGLFINTVPVRVKQSPETSFETIVAAIHRQAVEGESHHYVQLADILRESEAGRDLFDHILVYENYPVEKSLESAGQQQEESPAEPEDEAYVQTNYDFNVRIIPGPEYRITFTFNASVHDPELVAQAGEMFGDIVEQLLASPAEALGAIHPLKKEKEERLLQLCSGPGDLPAAGMHFPDRFREMARLYPARTALQFGEKSFSYSSLQEHSRAVARKLTSHNGLSKGDIVAILLPRSEWSVIALLGIWQAGGCYLMLDDQLPQQRIDFILQDSQARAVIDTHWLQDMDIIPADETGLPVTTGPADAAYLLYTSGTTGLPKGVLIGHGAIADYITGLEAVTRISACSACGLVSTLAADLGNTILFPALAFGNCLHLLPEETSKDGHLMQAYQDRHHLDAIKIVPSHWEALQMQDRLTVPVQLLIFGGEELTPAVVDKLKKGAAPELRVFNHYGPTETTIGKLIRQIDWQSEHPEINLGRPFGDAEVLIVDRKLRLLPPGAKGEIVIGGSGLARGYLNQPGLTDEKFVGHPYRTGKKLYRTGDLGRLLMSGEIEFFGRTDQQVKVRGYRIEPAEVEYAYTSFPGIARAVALVRQGAGGADLVLYYTTTHPVDPVVLEAMARAALPGHMVPKYCIHLAEMPLTANGKVDRKALPEPGAVQLSSGSQAYEAPQTENERILAQVWQEVLGVRRAGAHDDFFALGGDSIKSIQVASRLRGHGLSIRVSDVLKYTRLDQQAARTQKLQREIGQGPVSGIIRLGPIQHRFFESNEPEKHHYNQSVLLTLPGFVSKAVIVQAMQQLYRHHDMLRCIYRNENELWIQEIPQGQEDYPEELITETDLRGSLSWAGELHDGCNRLQESFVLGSGPLFRCGIFRCDDGDRLLLLTHHLVSDGISWRILMEDMAGLLEAGMTGKAWSLPPKTDSFAHWQEKLHAYAAGESLQEQLSYWQSVEASVDASLPADFEIKERRISDMETVSSTLGETLYARLRKEANTAYGTEMNELLLAACGTALSRHFGRNRISFSMEGHGREDLFDDTDVSRTVGWFTSRYPFVFDHAGDDTAGAIIGLKEKLRQVPGKGIGYGLLRYLSAAAGQWNNEPPVSYNYLGEFGNTGSGEEQPAQPRMSLESKGEENSPRNKAAFAFGLVIVAVNGQLVVSLSYSGKEYKKSTAEKLLGDIEKELRIIADHCISRQLPLKTPSDFTASGIPLPEALRLQERYRIEDIYALSPLQQGIYFHAQMDQDIHAYFEQLNIRLRGIRSPEALAQSYAQLVRRHAILRTAFTVANSRIMQIVLESAGEPLYYEDIRHLSPDEQSEYLGRFRENDRMKYFDLDQGGLMRMAVFQVADDEHELVWSHHHILMDGWCMGILVSDLFQAYYAFRGNSAPQLPPVHPYSEYISWLENRDKKASLHFWADYLNGFQAASVIPGHPVPAGATYQRGQVKLELSRELSQRLLDLTRKMKVTTNTVVQALWAALLARVNDVEDICFGMVVSGRPAELTGIEKMIGLFINTVPVRIRPGKTKSFSRLLQEIQDDAIAASAHHYIQLADIQTASALGRELFDHIMIFENYPIQENLPGGENGGNAAGQEQIELLRLNVFEQTNYHFNITVEPGSEIVISFGFNAAQHDPAVIAGMSEQLRLLAESLLEDPEGIPYEVPLLAPEEKQAILADSIDADEEEAISVTALFSQQVEKQPDMPAIKCGNRVLTYRELDERSSSLAAYLMSQHMIRPESRIGIRLHRSEWLPVAMLAVLKSGGAYVPVSPDFPEQRVQYITEESALEFIIGEELIEAFTLVQPQPEKTGPPAVRKPEQLAYVMFTSGSTGQPKGVMIEDRNLSSFFRNMTAVFGFQPGDTIAAMTNYTFDISNLEMLGAICSGMCVRLCTDEETADPFRLLAGIRGKAEILQMTPSRLEQFLSIDPLFHQAFRVILVGGEALKPSHFDLLSKSPARVYNVYGPTETTIWSSALCLNDAAALSIGRALPAEALYIMDERGELLPPGIPGEIVIGGAGVGRGYINRDELTARVFVQAAFDESKRLYRTGDKGCRMPDGTIRFIGRNDDQIKIHGYRIEPGEIETQLLRYPGIFQAAVVVRENPASGRFLAAFYASAAEQGQDDLRQWLAASLPAYMVPAVFVRLDALPVNSSGKLDRKALPVTEIQAPSAAAFALPGSATEEQVLRIWQDILGLEKISVTAGFFELGGNSIHAIGIIARIRSEFRVELAVRDFFTEPTIRDAARLVDNLLWLSGKAGDDESPEDNESITI